MPTAAAVPMTVEMIEALKARIRVFFRLIRVSPSFSSSRYHLKEKPENTDRLLLALKENTSRMTMGANRKAKISAV